MGSPDPEVSVPGPEPLLGTFLNPVHVVHLLCLAPLVLSGRPPAGVLETTPGEKGKAPRRLDTDAGL